MYMMNVCGSWVMRMWAVIKVNLCNHSSEAMWALRTAHKVHGFPGDCGDCQHLVPGWQHVLSLPPCRWPQFILSRKIEERMWELPFPKTAGLGASVLQPPSSLLLKQRGTFRSLQVVFSQKLFQAIFPNFATTELCIVLRTVYAYLSVF
jgi:hypothetical protein